MKWSIGLESPFAYRKSRSLVDKLVGSVKSAAHAISRARQSVSDTVADAYDNARRTTSGSAIVDGLRAAGSVAGQYAADAAQWSGKKTLQGIKYTGAFLSTFIPISWGAMPADVSMAYGRAVGVHPHLPFWTSVLGGDMEAILAVVGVHVAGIHVPAWAAALGSMYFVGMLENNFIRTVNYFRTGRPQASYYSPIYGSINLAWNAAKSVVGQHYRSIERAARYVRRESISLAHTIRDHALDYLETQRRTLAGRRQSTSYTWGSSVGYTY